MVECSQLHFTILCQLHFTIMCQLHFTIAFELCSVEPYYYWASDLNSEVTILPGPTYYSFHCGK